MQKQVIGIVRCSGKEGDATLVRQEALIKEYCKKCKLTKPNILIDRHKSGFKAGRQALIELRELISSDKVSHVIFVSLDRLVRNTRVGLELLDLFVKKKIVFVSLTETLKLENASDKFIIQTYLNIGENFRNQISDKMKVCWRYKRENNLKGSGYCLYGYEVVNNKLVPNEIEQAVIAEMVKLRRFNKLSYAKIAKIFTEKNIPTRTGKGTWDGRTIQNIIKRELANKPNEAA